MSSVEETPIKIEPIEDEEETFDAKGDRFFAEFCEDSGLDINVFSNSKLFERYIKHLNESARLPQPKNTVPVEVKQEIEEEVEEMSEDPPSTSTLETPIKETSSAVDLMRKGNAIPCIICSVPIMTHQSAAINASDAIKALMGGILCETLDEDYAIAAVAQHPLRMCTKHNDEVYHWISSCIGAWYESQVDSAPIELMDVAYMMYRRLKVARDEFEGKTPSNPSMGAFRLAIKSYFRNFVPLRKNLHAKQKAKQQSLANAPVAIHFQKFLKAENFNLTEEEEGKLFRSIKPPGGFRIKTPLNVYEKTAIADAKIQKHQGTSEASSEVKKSALDRTKESSPYARPQAGSPREGTSMSSETKANIPDTKRYMRVVPKPIRGIAARGRGKFVLRPQATATVHAEEKPQKIINKMNWKVQDAGEQSAQDMRQEIKEEVLDDDVPMEGGNVDEPSDKITPKKEIKEEQQLHLDLRSNKKTDVIPIIEIKEEPLVLDLRSKTMNKEVKVEDS